ncbi:unnamed protein product (plasmid) [Mycetohabitans rhizoxinica HKI 454]|uniref:Uncharacterized protein n=1 Tax=Mycetohabitans rhizoxinica (strain DSM 19002 / CIP 109453 / HKI 454) TaxID=882378 RepID=E5ATN5_MYCRK|nr:unnamed protein product [Mycetohabitans rhizoxinica HKI 454]
MRVSPWHYLANHYTCGYRYHLSDSAPPAARAEHHRANLHMLLVTYALAQLLCLPILMLWVFVQCGKPLSSLTREDP